MASFEFDQAELEDSSEGWHAELVDAVTVALRSLPADHRPGPRDVETIAHAFADYLVICRTGDLDDYVHWARAGGREPLIPDNLEPEKRDLFWESCTLWARAALPRPDTVATRTLFVRGERKIESLRNFQGSGPIRLLDHGTSFWNDPHALNVIELQISALVPSIDGETTADVRIGVVFANAGPGNAWLPMTVLSHDAPPNFILFLPPT